MELIIALIASTVSVLLMALELCFLLHAVLSLFAGEDNMLYRFTGWVIEPIVRPVRALLVKLNWLQNTPFDFSFFIAYLLLSVVTIFIG